MAHQTIRLTNGNLLIPIPNAHGDYTCDSLVEISPDHPDYARWLAGAEPGERPALCKDRRTWIPREEDLTPEGWRS
jgi:hypothetical protein